MNSIVTPKGIAIINADSKIVDAVLTGSYTSVHVSDRRLTSCCKFGEYIVCAGFSGELFYVKKSLVEKKKRVSSSIIRCLVENNGILFVTTDAGEIILIDGNEILFTTHTESPVYKIIAINDKTLLSAERNGNIKEWMLVSGNLVLNRTVKKIARPVFAMGIVDGRLVIGDSFGERYIFDSDRKRTSNETIASCNLFCLTEGIDSAIYYGLDDGSIIREIEGDKKIIQGHQGAVRDIVFSPDKQWMFSVGKDNVVRAWNKDFPSALVAVKDYLYQIIVDKRFVAFVDGHGDLGCIYFDGDIDNAKELTIQGDSE